MTTLEAAAGREISECVADVCSENTHLRKIESAARELVLLHPDQSSESGLRPAIQKLCVAPLTHCGR